MKNDKVLKFTTSIMAIDPNNGEFCEWDGPTIEANSWHEAERYCQENGLGYCKIVGIKVMEGLSAGDVSFSFYFVPV